MIDRHNNASAQRWRQAGEKWYLNPHVHFVLFNIVFVAAFFSLLQDLLLTAWRSEYYSYIPFIPIISGYLIHMRKKEIFLKKKKSFGAGLLLLGSAAGLLFLSVEASVKLDHNDYLSAITLSMIALWIGGFTLCYGTNSFRSAIFPLLFLLFAVPLPNAARESIILFLQSGSTEVTDMILKLSGLFYIRDGFLFHLPGMNIEVAKECSGIRSSLSLVVTGALAGHMFLRTAWARTAFMTSIIPIAILKNGIRIAVLTLLGTYWDARILDSDLHRKGGFLFFLMALMLCGGVIVLLKKAEKKPQQISG